MGPPKKACPYLGRNLIKFLIKFRDQKSHFEIQDGPITQSWPKLILDFCQISKEESPSFPDMSEMSKNENRPRGRFIWLILKKSASGTLFWEKRAFRVFLEKTPRPF